MSHVKASLLAAILLLLKLGCWGAEPWPGLEFSEARAYAWPQEMGIEEMALEDFKLPDGAINPSGALLTSEQVKVLTETMSAKPRRHLIAACYLPHNAFVFFDASGEPVAFIEICFDCMRHRSSPKGSSDYPNLHVFADIFESHKLPIGKFENLAAFNREYERTILDLDKAIAEVEANEREQAERWSLPPEGIHAAYAARAEKQGLTNVQIWATEPRWLYSRQFEDEISVVGSCEVQPISRPELVSF